MAFKIVKKEIDRKPTDTSGAYSKKQRYELVAAYLAMGNLAAASEACGIGYNTAVAWKKQGWWKNYENEIRQASRVEVSGKLKRVIDKALHLVEDRLEHGDITGVNKEGKLLRKPVNAKVAGELAVKAIDKKVLLDKIQEAPDTEPIMNQIEERMKLLEQKLIMAASRKAKVIEGELIRE